MKISSSIGTGSPPSSRTGEQGGARTVLMAATCFALGVGAGALWFYRPPGPVAINAIPDATNLVAVASAANSPAPVSPASRKNLPPSPPQPASPATIQEVKQIIPNLGSVTLEQGMQTLRMASFKEFAAAANDLQREVEAAQQNLSKAQNSGSETERQAAIKQLQLAQTSQTEKLQEIAARSKAQLEAFQQLKADSHESK